MRASVAAACWLSSCGTQAESFHSMWSLSSPGIEAVSCIARWILIHWTTKEGALSSKMLYVVIVHQLVCGQRQSTSIFKIQQLIQRSKEVKTRGKCVLIPECWSPTPAARDSTWKSEWCRRWDSLSFFYGLPVYSKFNILFYTFTRTLGHRFDIFRSLSPRFIISINPCCSSNRVPASVILSESAFSSSICLF